MPARLVGAEDAPEQAPRLLAAEVLEGGTPRLLHEKIFDTTKYCASLADHDA